MGTASQRSKRPWAPRRLAARHSSGRRRTFAASLLATLLLLAGCSSTATVSEITETGDTQTGDETEQADTDRSGDAQPTPDSPDSPGESSTADSTDPSDPTAPVPEEGSEAEEPDPTATPSEAGAELTALAPESFRTDNVQAISHHGSFAYAGATSPWNDPTSCTAAARQSLAALSVETAAAGAIEPFGAELIQTGDVRQMLVGPDRSVAVLSSCGDPDDARVWIQRANIDDFGRLVDVSDRIEFDTLDSSDPYLLNWAGPDSIEFRVIVEDDPDDVETWTVQRRQIDFTTGETVTVASFGYFDDEEWESNGSFVADAGTYRVIDDPAGGVGCEGFGIARTIELDDGTDTRLALTQPDLVFAQVNDLHTSPGGYVAWTSGCEGFVSAYVGKVLQDGSIADAHFVETYNLLGSGDDFSDYRAFRLTDDDHLVGVGQTYGPDGQDASIAVLRYDLRTDPNFVNTADPAPAVEVQPLFESIDGTATWHVGETLAVDPACGAVTLYGRTDGGLVRAFPAGIEIDRIVDVDLGPIHEYEFSEGETFSDRTVVVQTECPEQYDGRRVWFGLETPNVLFGLTFARADLVDVADVLAVRDELGEQGFVDATFVEVELLDGTVTEVELVALPFDS